MIRKTNLLTFLILTMNFCAQAQSGPKYVIDYSTATFPIYYSGNVTSIHFSKNKDTTKIVKWEHHILIEKLNDTILISEFYKGKQKIPLEIRSEYKFSLGDSLIFNNKKYFLNFPEIEKLLFMKKAPSSNKLFIPIRAYTGKEDISPFPKTDTLLNYSQTITIRGTKKRSNKKSFRILSIPKTAIDLYCLEIIRTSESDRYPYLPEGMRLPKETMENSKALQKNFKSYKYVFTKNADSNNFNGFITEETRKSSSKYNHDDTKMIGVYILETIDQKTLENIKG